MSQSKYPKGWRSISKRIKERDGWKCTVCYAPNGIWIKRKPNSLTWMTYVDWLCDSRRYTVYKDWKEYQVVLRVIHQGFDRPDGRIGDPDDKQDCRDENLTTLCQTCFGRYQSQCRLRRITGRQDNMLWSLSNLRLE